MNVLLVDDERLARNELKKLIVENCPDPVVHEAKNGHEALSAYESFRPHVMFVDIKMPGMSGFEMLEKMPLPLPEVVFTTAYSEYAIKAFEFNALDYLVKPIDPERFKNTIQRVQARILSVAAPQTVESDAEPLPTGQIAPDHKVFVREGDKCWFVAAKDIRLLESEGNYTRVLFLDESPLLLRSLNSLEERLDPNAFFRANRAQIININHIRSVEPWFSGGLKVILEGGREVEFSRRQARAFREKKSL
ncbi:LytTR family DNA-binding domain-containing protein [Oscillatoria amoena NRMC-F 0135]|nr:LytTR family DNA-binding domain-containing protein [Oscillatoria amoena NRMC-F 0135]